MPKARILQAVREGKDDASAQLIDHPKKPEMAKEAERLLAGTGWLPQALRPTDAQVTEIDCKPEVGADSLPAFFADGEEGADGPTPSDPEEPQSHAVATE